MTGIDKGLDYLLSLFNHQIHIWPRTISTKATEAKQVKVYSREQALTRFEEAGLVDCRISAYPYWRPTLTSDLAEIKNAIAPNFIMIDLDACNFDNDYDELAHILRQILWRIRDNLAGYKPTVIWSGRGYHILVQIQVPVLENVKEFLHIEQVSTKFIRFVESYLSDGKSDHSHNSSVSLYNCMLRVPGSINSKNGATVDILKKCKSQPASISLLIGSFCAYLESEKIREAKYSNYHKVSVSPNPSPSPTIYYWIEKLLQTGISDHRKNCSWRIVAPYLINVRKLCHKEAFEIMSAWLDKCSQVRRLHFNRSLLVNYDLCQEVKRGFYPHSIPKLYAEHPELADFLQRYGIFEKI